jgi:replicative DNA helicase
MENKFDKTRKTGNRLNKMNKIGNIAHELGKVPPQAVDLEMAVLGALMLEKNAVTDTIDILSKDSFYDPKHQYVFNVIRELFGTTKPIDILTVTDMLKKNGELEAAGGAAYISKLTSRIASTAHVEYHSRIIAEKHIKRELIRMSGEVMREAYDETNDVFDVLNKAESELFKIAENNMGKAVGVMQDVVREAIEEMERASQNSDGISGIPTGFYALDKVTAGWQKSDMIVIAGRPGMGKTAFALSMARNTAVDHGKAVAIFTLEMSAVQLVKRLISSETHIPAEKLRKGDLRDDEFQQLHTRITKLATAPIYVDDSPGISIFDLRAKCRRLKMQHNIELVIIDYLQLMTTGSSKGAGNREQEISSISRSIKEIAKELNIPIIALAQLSRSVEQRGGDKKPILSDLRESGAIEQDADIVSFIYRPEYYGFMQDEEGNSNAGIGELIVAKHRNGALDTVRLRFIKEFARFENIEAFQDSNNIGEHAKLPSNADFDDQGNYTIPSKMNTIKDKESDNLDFDAPSGDETPF